MAIAGDYHEKLADYIRTLSSFTIYKTIDGGYDHVGATLADAVLQANNNYERNVRHRIERIRTEYVDYTTISDLDRLLERMTVQEFLHWNGTRKPTTLLNLLDLLRREQVNTETDIYEWLQQKGSRAKLLDIAFIGKKTVDYLGILVGIQGAAIDRHLIAFLCRAGITGRGYEEPQMIIHQTADLMGISRSHLDHSIWRYMSAPALAMPVVKLVVEKKHHCPRTRYNIT